MKQDIRKLFKKEYTDNSYDLPSGHRKEFQKKLQPEHKNIAFGLLSRVAVIALVLIGTSFAIYNSQTQVIPDENKISQIDLIEEQYLKNIEFEWQEFISNTNDSTLIKRFDSKLKDLDKDYKKFTNQLKSNPDNTLVIQSLIENLQTRLELLEDIQTHIKILNSKPEDHEKML
jgi:hypothetical protein